MFDIRDRIVGKKGKELNEDDLIQLHHDFMVVYGWIPLEEFKELPNPTLWNLAEKVMEEKNKRLNFMAGVLMGVGAKKNQINWLFK